MYKSLKLSHRNITKLQIHLLCRTYMIYYHYTNHRITTSAAAAAYRFRPERHFARPRDEIEYYYSKTDSGFKRAHTYTRTHTHIHRI